MIFKSHVFDEPMLEFGDVAGAVLRRPAGLVSYF